MIASGAGQLGSWHAVRRSLTQDYRRLFGGEPGRFEPSASRVIRIPRRVLPGPTSTISSCCSVRRVNHGSRSRAALIDWLVFIAVSVVSNTPVPIAFDPVMLHFARTHPGDQAWVAAIVGALGAGAGGMCEMVAFRFLRRRVRRFRHGGSSSTIRSVVLSMDGGHGADAHSFHGGASCRLPWSRQARPLWTGHRDRPASATRRDRLSRIRVDVSVLAGPANAGPGRQSPVVDLLYWRTSQEGKTVLDLARFVSHP